MRNKIKSILSCYFKKSDRALRVGNNTILESMKYEIRGDEKNNVKISIGDDSLISGSYIIDNNFGKISIGSRTFIGGGLFISAIGIEIGDDVMISWGCTMIDNDSHSLNFNLRKNDVADWKKGIIENKIGRYKNWEDINSKKIVIKDSAWIGFNSIILKGVTIGYGAIVGCGSVVTKDVPNYCLVAGNPARFIKRLDE
jgi:acetyltransferase-like isoleucine patch superfamily enzyme